MKIGYFSTRMQGARIERWTTARTLMVAVRKDGDSVEPLVPADKVEDRQSYLMTFVQSARELIFDNSGEFPVFHAIGYYLTPDPIELSVGAGFSLLLDYSTEQERNEWIVLVLGLGVAYDVPIYPNTEEEAALLAQHFRELHTSGVLAPNEDDKKVRLKLTHSPGDKIATFAWLDELKHTDSHFPAELVLIRAAVREELAKRDEASRVLGSLRLAIAELEELLTAQRRNERALQRSLERNPILFGPEYERIIPKHRLGAEYEMDYALQRVSGLVDLAEIESSNLKLFKRNGDPTVDLTHAEQQVLNWLEWIERNEAYAREKLPNIMRPAGYVIIGRSSMLDDADRRRLNLRNTLFGGSLQILTYDDLLSRGKNLLRLLEGSR